MSAYTDAQAQNDITRNVRQWKDLALFFGRKTVSKDAYFSDKKKRADFTTRCTTTQP